MSVTEEPSQPDRGTVIAIDFGGTKIDVAWADHAGRILIRQRLATLATGGPEQALERAASVVRDLIEDARNVDRPVVSVAAVAPGVVHEEGIFLVPNLPGWETLALTHRLSELLEVAHVPVWNDVRAGALAELRHGNLQNSDPGLYLSLGTGIAAAITIGDNVLEGAHRAAGEVAYTLVDDRPAGAAAHDPTLLEEIIGGRALGLRASAHLGESVDAASLFARTDPQAQQLVHHALGVLAGAVVNMAVLVDPARIVVGGGMMASAAPILHALSARLSQDVPFPPQIAAAHFTQDASLHGAIALALDARPARTPQPTTAGGSR